MAERILDEYKSAYQNDGLSSFLNLNKERRGTLYRQNFHALVKACLLLQETFPSPENHEASPAYQYASLTWSLKRASRQFDSPFDPREVSSSAQVLLEGIGEGKIIPMFSETKNSEKNPLSASDYYIIQFNTRYGNAEYGKFASHYGSVVLGKDFSNRFYSHKTKGEALASLYASGFLISQIENPPEDIKGKLDEDEEGIVPILKIATLSMGPMAARHKGFREFYEILQGQEANPY